MVTIIRTTPEQMRLMSLLKGNNKKLAVKGNREVAIEKNNKLIKNYRKDIVQTAMEA